MRRGTDRLGGAPLMKPGFHSFANTLGEAWIKKPHNMEYEDSIFKTLPADEPSRLAVLSVTPTPPSNLHWHTNNTSRLHVQAEMVAVVPSQEEFLNLSSCHLRHLHCNHPLSSEPEPLQSNTQQHGETLEKLSASVVWRGLHMFFTD